MSFLDVMNDDLKNVLDAEFSEDITITSGTNSVTVKGFFDKSFTEVDPETTVPVLSSNPRVVVFESDVPFKVPQGSKVITRGKTYTVIKPKKTGDGGLALYLE